MNARLRLLGAAFVITISCCGCFKTFRSHRIVNEMEPFWGTPATVFKIFIAKATWRKEVNGRPVITQTTHLCKLPVLYGVDVIKAPIGTTTGIFEFNADGTLKKSHAVVDQQVDEFIKAISEAVGNLAPAGQRADTSEITFQPPLPADGSLGEMVDIQFYEASY